MVNAFDNAYARVPQQSFDDALRVAVELCKVTYAIICLKDGEHLQVHASFSARGGKAAPEVCREARIPDDLAVVTDLQALPKRTHILLPGGATRFYVAVPLRTSTGGDLGVLCLLDDTPRPAGLTEAQQACLQGLARQIVTLFKLQRAAHEHRGQQILHQRILDSATDYAIIAMDRGGRVTRWNTGAEQILGWREGEMLGDPAHVFFTPEDRADGRPETEMALALKNGRAPDERWHLRKGGERFFASGEMMPLKDETGTVQGFLKILRDRSWQRADEAALSKVQDQLRLAVSATDVGIFDYDLITGKLGWDARTCALFGLPAGTAVSYDTFLAGLHPEDRDWVDQAVKTVLAPGSDGTYDIAYRTIGLQDGIERWVAAKGQVFFENGRAVRFIGTTRDITEDRRAEQVLRETEERYRMAARATNDAIWDWNLASDHIRWNEAVQT
ncbi:PAS domain S-box protein, partial [Methylobacterium sp. CCH5-D2]|uniref:PAS domain S-box protein n=1 Tax=Methylobacterium sp. CCH5-D2 TaxID=1768765 RepID=UPI000AADA0BC